MSDEFIKHAHQVFDFLKWKRVVNGTIPQTNIVYEGPVAFFVLDPAHKLFKVELAAGNETDRLSAKCVVHYETDVEAIGKLDHYLDVIGMFYKEATGCG